MGVISFQCPKCKQVLKIGAEKAGRKGKCKCGADITVPAASTTEPAAPKPGPAAAPKPEPQKDDDGEGVYGIAQEAAPTEAQVQARKEALSAIHGVLDEDEEEEEDEDDDEGPAKRPKGGGDPRTLTRGPGRTKRAQLAHIAHPEQWEKVRLGILLVFLGTCLWIIAILLEKVALILGLFAGNQYGRVAVNAEPGWGHEMARYLCGMVVGADSLETGLTLWRIAQVLMALQGLLVIGGYAVCLSCPGRFGSWGMALTCLCVAFVNLILNVVFRLLPAVGTIKWALVPLVGWELPMLNANLERTEPLHVFWCSYPFWELLLTYLIMFLGYAEPLFFALFLWGAALSIRDDTMYENRASAMVQIALGVAFIPLGYHVLAMTGTSEVLLWVLRVVYGLAACFLLGQLAWYCHNLMLFRRVLAFRLKFVDTEREEADFSELQDDEDDDEDDEDDD